jgi:PAS domain S-box-containing protein
MKNAHNKSDSEILRQKAEELLKLKPSGLGSPISETDMLKLIHELEVHQVELEMQNEELMLAKSAAQDAVELYDFSPMGYYTLSREGQISNANRAGSKILGKERARLINSRFGFFVSDNTKPNFNLFIENVFCSKNKEECEVTLQTSTNLPMYVHLTGIVTNKGDQCLITIEDITDRKHAEEERKETRELLRVSEQRFHNLFDKANEGLILLTMDGKIAEVNQSFAMMHGYTVSELKNMDIRDLDVLRESAFESRAEVMRRINAGEVVRFEVEHFHKDGHSFFISNTVSKINIDDQQFYLAFHQDITERKQAEVALQKSEELYRKLLNTIPDIIVITDIEGNITYASDKLDSFLENVPKENIYGKNMLSFIAEHDLPRAIENTNLMFNNALGVKEYQLKFSNNISLDAEINGDIIRDRENNPLGIVFVIRNINERKRLEEEKRRTDSRILTLSMAIEQSPVTTVITDLAGNIEFVNPKFTETTGYTAEEAIGKNSRILKSGDKPDTEYKELWDTILSGQNWHGVFQNKRKNGELYWESAVISAVRDNEGAITHFLAVKEDITDRKKSEEEIKRKNEQLIQLNAEKDKFFSIISHDLRGPFNGFLGLTRVMAEDLQDFTKEQIQKMAASMRDSATNLFGLLENLLEWSRLQRGITTFEPQSFLLMPMMAETMRPVMDSANRKGIEISVEIPNDLEVFADEYMLASTIRNLASNAVKFTTKGGKVTIAANTIPGNSVEFSIMDTGIGMYPEMVHDLFRLDVQTNRKGTENEPSSGLGLLLCKDFVEKHGGTLWVESEEGKGSVFYFSIPDNPEILMKTVITNSVSEEEKEVQIKRMKILIAEDDEISDSLISAMVDKYSYEVLHVNTGVDAIHACLNNPDIDLVLMDINLTGMDGFEATRQIRQFNNDVVIIAQTAFSLKFDRVMAIEAGCNDYINKPISNSELQGLIRKYFTE